MAHGSAIRPIYNVLDPRGWRLVLDPRFNGLDQDLRLQATKTLAVPFILHLFCKYDLENLHIISKYDKLMLKFQNFT